MSASKFITLGNVKSTLSFSTLILSTLDNIGTMLLFSTSSFTWFINVEIPLWIWPFSKSWKEQKNIIELQKKMTNLIKAVLSGVRQFLPTEGPLKMMKNAFYFTSKALSVFKIFKLLSWLFGHVSKRLDQFYDVTAWLTNNCNTRIAQYRQK